MCPSFNVLQAHLATNYTPEIDIFLENSKQFEYFEPLLAEFDKKESFFGKSVKDKVMTNFKGILAQKLETEDLDQV